MRKLFELGGLFAAVVLIVFGAVAITMGINGRHTVAKSLQNEYIVGTPDMTPSAIRAEAQKAGIASAVTQWPGGGFRQPTTDRRRARHTSAPAPLRRRR